MKKFHIKCLAQYLAHSEKLVNGNCNNNHYYYFSLIFQSSPLHHSCSFSALPIVLCISFPKSSSYASFLPLLIYFSSPVLLLYFDLFLPSLIWSYLKKNCLATTAVLVRWCGLGSESRKEGKESRSFGSSATQFTVAVTIVISLFASSNWVSRKE